MLEADHGTGEMKEGLVDVGSSLVSHHQSAEPVLPREAALNDPAISAEPLSRLDALACDPRQRSALVEPSPEPSGVVGLVGVQLVRPASRRAQPARAKRLHAAEELFCEGDVVRVRRGDAARERDALVVDEQMVLGARPTSVGRVWPCLLTPLFAGTL